MRSSSRAAGLRAYTLTEVVIVVAVIGVLSTTATAAVQSVVSRSRCDAAGATLDSVVSHAVAQAAGDELSADALLSAAAATAGEDFGVQVYPDLSRVRASNESVSVLGTISGGGVVVGDCEEGRDWYQTNLLDGVPGDNVASHATGSGGDRLSWAGRDGSSSLRWSDAVPAPVGSAVAHGQANGSVSHRALAGVAYWNPAFYSEAAEDYPDGMWGRAYYRVPSGQSTPFALMRFYGCCADTTGHRLSVVVRPDTGALYLSTNPTLASSTDDYTGTADLPFRVPLDDWFRLEAQVSIDPTAPGRTTYAIMVFTDEHSPVPAFTHMVDMATVGHTADFDNVTIGMLPEGAADTQVFFDAPAASHHGWIGPAR